MRIAGVILAAGRGSRMGTMTANTPKPMLHVAGRPMLGHVADRLVDAGVSSIFINLFYNADKIQSYVTGIDFGCPVVCRVEDRLTGPAGALNLFRDELAKFDLVLISSADVLLEESLSVLVRQYVATPASLIFGCTTSNYASRYGVLNLGDDGTVISCVEKPDVPDDEVHHISAGVYCVEPDVPTLVPNGTTYDFARDLAPELISRGKVVRACVIRGYWRDLGTPDALASADHDARNGTISWLRFTV